MILLAGGTGRLGMELVPRLMADGARVRVLSRNPELARTRLGAGPDFVQGDVQAPDSLEKALQGVDCVVSAVTGFGPGGVGPWAVDYIGNLNLIRAAEATGVRRFVLLSMHGVAAEHPMELLRLKYRAEQALQASRLEWTIVRPTVFMELWIGIVGDPIVHSRTTAVSGRGDNPVNFVSVRDVASVVALALAEPRPRREFLEVGGPEDVSIKQPVRRIELAAGGRAKVRNVPIAAMRLAHRLIRPIRADIAGMIEAGITLETTDMSFDAANLRRRFPQLQLTSVADVLQRQFGPSHRHASPLPHQAGQAGAPESFASVR